MKRLLEYLTLTVVFAFMSCGVLIAACMDSFDTVGYRFFWMLVPLTGLFVAMVEVNLRIAVPRMLLRNRLIPYAVCMLLLALSLTLCAVGCEYLMRRVMGLPMRIGNYGSSWILVDMLCNSILLFLIMLGVGFMKVYEYWRREMRREQALASSLREYISVVKSRLNPEVIIARLDRITGLVRVSVDKAGESIEELCGYLRRQLYELPAPAAIRADEGLRTTSVVMRLFVSRRLGPVRHLCFQLILLLISFGVFFNTPDSPEFSFDRFTGFLSMYLLLDVIAYTDILWLYPRFRRSGNMRRFIGEVGALTVAVVVPLILLQVLTYEPSPYAKAFPLPVMVIATVGSVVTVMMFLAGISAALLLQNWLRGQRRMTLLNAEYVRQEYAFLCKQINPHFLFNVLNNAGILSEEDPEESERMLRELRRLLVRQFEETGRASTSLGEEISFLRSYLSLEATRIEPFEFSITAEGCGNFPVVPTLVFITFVENAVKHSDVVGGHRKVEVGFRVCGGDVLEFRCANTFRGENHVERYGGGVGLSNTLRRLELLYGDEVRFSRTTTPDSYVITIRIPYDKMCDS